MDTGKALAYRRL